jgi:PncC family amidohydrolase
MIRSLSSRLGRLLARTGKTLAVAESCTGGMLCAAVTDIAGSSAYFRGGIVAYHDAVKIKALGVPEVLIAAHGAVSEKVAASMAEGVRNRLSADIGIGITGIAGPGGGTPEKPVGTVWIGIAAGEVRRSDRRLFAGDRETVRREAVAWALSALLSAVEDRGGENG